ncbi:MAG: patatin-like phospholipase family protein [Actinomycetota bacterium]|nr:patatin-like phospholipase family protein [Actinomycetota bacterium]
MGLIVHIGGGHVPDAPRRKLKEAGKRALVLGGGGIAGASFEVGALLALNDVLSGFKANDFDVFVGTSAGAFLCACLVNGITPEDFARSQISRPPPHVPSITRREILRPVPQRIWRGAKAWAEGLKGTAKQVARAGQYPSVVDVFFSLADDLKSSLYTTEGIHDYLRRLFAMQDRTDDFAELDKELFITATDLDTAERIIFGAPDMPTAPISHAVAASAAVPIIYEPVKIGGREYLDGGLRSATNLDIALANGADFVVLVNPLVPYLHDRRYLLRAFDSPIRHVSEGGLGRLVAQVFRIMAHAQLEKELDLLTTKYPNVDVLVIEPRADDEHLFVFNLMDYSAREQLAKDAFEQVAVELVTDFPDVKRLFAKTGIGVSKKEVLAQLEHVLAGGTASALVEPQTEETA